MQKKLSNNNDYLPIIKRILNASFVGWITEKDKKSLRIKIKNKEFLLPIEGEINEHTYKDLIKNLLKDEGGEIQTTL